MPSKIRHGLLISIAVIALFLTSIAASYAEIVNYIYDDLNRLIRVVSDNGTVIQYTYSEVGNRLEERVGVDRTPPTGIIVIDSAKRRGVRPQHSTGGSTAGRG